MKLIMISGGVRSGKSRYAEEMAHQLSLAGASTILPTSQSSSPITNGSVLYVATGHIYDDEMRTRIEAHRNRRPSEWGLLETPDKLTEGVANYEGYPVILVDSLSAWVGNQLMAVSEEQCRSDEVTMHVKDEIQQWLHAMRTKLSTEAAVFIVTDEVGWGGVAMNPLGRWFQDVIGDANQQLAAEADEVFAVISGLPLRLKG
ncbi:hypothetical protein SY83_08820 [Paenibacillus swuensis]|uniref:Adenosylcobinamide kinase n=1 Tax=Paenibacillus swuensis TaxID=1178515 RepID=A0A172THJ9_9BACL|nr:bifunctional adenosylcobinamide kinase/adenosylcobinamide-phosphate guanylyltransferase [Paenibacillus swuensis]ANE46364.1 hypothetical protein SY83_08820 [Paenibacillus swuensis]